MSASNQLAAAKRSLPVCTQLKPAQRCNPASIVMGLPRGFLMPKTLHLVDVQEAEEASHLTTFDVDGAAIPPK